MELFGYTTIEWFAISACLAMVAIWLAKDDWDA